MLLVLLHGLHRGDLLSSHAHLLGYLLLLLLLLLLLHDHCLKLMHLHRIRILHLLMLWHKIWVVESRVALWVEWHAVALTVETIHAVVDVIVVDVVDVVVVDVVVVDDSVFVFL